MKVIDLLNKIANGEEVPNFIVGEIEYYMGANGYLRECMGDDTQWFIDKNWLNTEIQILEEEKKIPEKLILYTLSNNDSADFTTLQDFNNRDIQRTINWILDYLKSKGE